jgi:serine/threonine-protein kinase RsbW
MAIARECGTERQDLDDVALAVSEAATNAILHGTTRNDAAVAVTVKVERGELQVSICDEGGGIRPRTDSPGAGLGLSVIAAVAQRLKIVSSDEGTKVHMAFPCPNAVAA